MSIHILCLNIIILLFTLSPMMLVGTFVNFPGVNKDKNSIFFTKALTYLLIIQIILILITNINFINFYIPKEIKWYIIAFVMVPIVILIEMLYAYIYVKIKGKRSIAKSGSNNRNIVLPKTIICTLLIGISEEIIFRMIWFNILNQLGVNIYCILIISAIVYGFNHIYMGNKVVVQKIISGLIYGTLYILSGSIIIPIITHATQNYIISVKGGVLKW